MPIDLTTQIRQFQPAIVSSSDTGSTGGAISATQISDAFRGEWFPKLNSSPSGVLYNAPDLKFQIQKTFIGHSDVAQTLLSASVFIANGVKNPVAPGFISLTSNNAADSNLYEGLFYIDVAGSLVTNHTVGLNGTAEVTGTAVCVKIFRGKLRNKTTGATYLPVGLVTVKIGGEVCGYFYPGCAWITSEVEIVLVSTTSDTGENSSAADRLTNPTGITTYAQAYLPALAIPVRNDTANASLAPGQFQGVWGKQTLQPGMPPSADVKLLLALQGDTA